jgi:hypothetical protein
MVVSEAGSASRLAINFLMASTSHWSILGITVCGTNDKTTTATSFFFPEPT